MRFVSEAKLDQTKSVAVQNIYERRSTAASMMEESVENIKKNCASDESIDDAFDDIDKLIDKLED